MEVYTRFQTKNGPKTIPFGAAHTNIAYIREHPPVKTAPDITRRHFLFTRGMTSEEQLQNLQITYKLRVTIQIWVAKIHGRTTIQKHYLDLSSDTSSL